MKIEKYQQYLDAFNARDYDTICSFFSPDIVLYTEGHTIKGEQGIRDFYRFFHAYVEEQIQLKRFAANNDHVFAEGTMHLKGIQHLSREKLEEMGYQRFVEVPQGLEVDVELFLHYDLNEAGQFTEIRCASYTPPEI